MPSRTPPKGGILRRGIAAALLLGGCALAAPAAAQGLIGPGSGRVGAQVAAAVALMGAVAGALAVARSTGRTRDAAVVALALGPMGMALAGLHLATNTGGIGTGSGRAGAIVALLLGLIGVVLGRRALTRQGRTG